MQVKTGPVVKDVVLVGAGHAHAIVLRRFGMKPIPGVRFTLITREVHTPYSGMLPGLVAGHYGFDDAHIDCALLARFSGARLFQDSVTGIDLGGQQVLCAGRPPVPFDLLSVDIGSTPTTQRVPGATEHVIPVKPIDGFLVRFEAMRARVLERRGQTRIALVGAGAAGVELLLAVEWRLRRDLSAAGHDPAALSFVLVSSAPEILPGFPEGFRLRFREIFARRGIAVETAARVERVEAGRLDISGGGAIEADEVLWTTQAAAPAWLAESGLALDDGGFIKVTATLAALGRTDVFGAGDVISFTPRALPKSGVYSVRAGPVLAENLRRTLTGQRLKRFEAQRSVLYLVSTGDGNAVGTRNGIAVAGRWVWRWKDHIDRRFMRRFSEFPPMAVEPKAAASPLADRAALKEISGIAMRCGGCGAKVGASVLSRALGRLSPVDRPDVIVGLDAPDDAAITDNGGPELSVHTVDYFRAIVDDPYIFGKIAANHALGDVFAMGGRPQTALAVATIPYGLEAKVEADLSTMMAGANEVLTDAGCALVGGHTSEGAELSLGFAINGLVERERLLRKGGLVPGDLLILTKPLGTGSLLAADMRGRAKASWVMAAISHMTRSNRIAAAILADHSVRAATDVTGFGLLGHLVEMTKASAVDAVLFLDRIPVLEGARETIAMGIFSSLQPQNVRLRRAIRDLDRVSAHPMFPLLFDPQTAGGLLAGVPGERAEAALAALRAAGDVQAAVIGEVRPLSDAVEAVVLLATAPPAQTSWVRGADHDREKFEAL